jgi:hypothetical protein
MIVLDSTGMVVGTTRVNCPLPSARVPREHIEIEGTLYDIVVVRAPSTRRQSVAYELSALMLPTGANPARLPGWEPIPQPWPALP